MNDVRFAMFTIHSNEEVELLLLNELKSPQYKPLRQLYLADNDYPAIEIMNCAIFDKLNWLTLNPAVQFDVAASKFKVCKNYIQSAQDLKEEFRRENALAALYHNHKHSSFNEQVSYFACAAIQGCRAEIEASTAALKVTQDDAM